MLVFVFVLLPALRRGGVEFCLLRLRLLYAFGVLAQTLAQQLMLFMKESSRWRSGRDWVCCAIAAATSSAVSDRGLAGRSASFWRSAAGGWSGPSAADYPESAAKIAPASRRSPAP